MIGDCPKCPVTCITTPGPQLVTGDCPECPVTCITTPDPQLVTGDGASSALAPIVHGNSVSAMVAQLEHPININQDGMLDLLHHKVNVTVTEAKEAVPSASVRVPCHIYATSESFLSPKNKCLVYYSTSTDILV